MTPSPTPAGFGWMKPDSHVVIVGGGFSGTLMAINLFRFGGPRTTLVERAPERLGQGIAYGTAHPSQLLNVRAAAMSAFPDDPTHFTRWLAARAGEGGSPADFVARTTYGAYLRETLAAVRAAAGERLRIVGDEVLAIERTDGTIRLTLASGSAMAADAVVLALGNLPPHTPPGIDPAVLPIGVYVDDPWTQDPAAGLGAGDRVVLVGSGLTAIDMALQLDAAGFGGEILALSRRGLSPRRHVDGSPPVAGLTETPDRPLSALVAQIRADADRQGWRAAVDALRPVTQHWWARADDATRLRFLRHGRPFWDVHRHRLAPVVADRIDALVAAGRLSFAAGKIVDVAAAETGAGTGAGMGAGMGARLRWRPRGQVRPVETVAHRIVNCTGPQGDVLRSDEPLLRQLIGGGTIRQDALRLGIDVDEGSHVVAADGTAQPDLYCVGPMTRGGYWEIVAVPDLRRQCADLGRRLSNAHWVGEGL